VKLLPILLLVSAGAALAWIAWRAPEREYVAPTPAEVAAHRAAPQKLAGGVPAGYVVRTIEVEGMCCTGCTGKLYERLKAVPGLGQAAVSFEEGLARVVIPERADPEPFAAALRFDKYAARVAD